MSKNSISVSLDPNSTGVTRVGFPAEHRPGGNLEALSVVAEQVTAADADWNVEFDGNDLFASEQSVASNGTPEEFVPDQNQYGTGDWVEVAVDVSSASAAGDTLVVTVTYEVDS